MLQPYILRFLVLCFTVIPVWALAQKKDSAKIVLNENYLQGLYDPSDADPEYIARFKRPNEIRGFFRAQSSNLEYGSTREVKRLNNTGYFKNTNNFVGIGITYKILDADISFSLPNKKIIDSSLFNLKQFKLAFSYTGRKYAARFYMQNAKGMVITDPQKRFHSAPDARMFRIGVQGTYIFNHQRYSLRSAFWQSELQKKIAGSFMIKVEPFFRSINTGSSLVPPDKDREEIYGRQRGLQFLRGPGILFMPGYGVNISFFSGQLYIDPMILAGPGLAYNFYRSAHGKINQVNLEWGGVALLNFGYNHPVMYVNFGLSGESWYTRPGPAFFSSTDIRFSLTLGVRLEHLEEFIPVNIF